MIDGGTLLDRQIGPFRIHMMYWSGRPILFEVELRPRTLSLGFVGYGLMITIVKVDKK